MPPMNAKLSLRSAEATELGEEEFEPQEDDIFLVDYGDLSAGTEAIQEGKRITSIAEHDSDWDKFEQAILNWMEEQNYYPNVWQVDDHGGHTLMELG